MSDASILLCFFAILFTPCVIALHSAETAWRLNREPVPDTVHGLKSAKTRGSVCSESMQRRVAILSKLENSDFLTA